MHSQGSNYRFKYKAVGINSTENYEKLTIIVGFKFSVDQVLFRRKILQLFFGNY